MMVLLHIIIICCVDIIFINRQSKLIRYRKSINKDFETYTFGKLERMQRATERWSKIAEWMQSCLSTPHSVHLLHLKDICAKTEDDQIYRSYLFSDYFSSHPIPSFTNANSEVFPYCLLSENKKYNRGYNFDLVTMPISEDEYYCMNVNKIASIKKTLDANEFTGFAMGQMPSKKDFTRLLGLWKANNIKICVTLGAWAGVTTLTPDWKTYGFEEEQIQKTESGFSVSLLRGVEDPTVQIMHFWFNDWPSPDSFIEKYDKVGEYVYAVVKGMHEVQKPYVTLVQCCDGVHRSGFFMAMLLAERMIEVTEIVNVPGIVYHLRNNRSPYCFQKKENLELLFQLILQYQIQYGKFADDVASVALPKMVKAVQKENEEEPSVTLSHDNEESSNEGTVKSITVANKPPKKTTIVSRDNIQPDKDIELSQMSVAAPSNTTDMFKSMNIF